MIVQLPTPPNITDLWQAAAEGLGTVLLAVLAWIGRMVLKNQKTLGDKLDRALENLNTWNNKFQVTLTDHEWRLDNLEASPTGRIERRRIPRGPQ